MANYYTGSISLQRRQLIDILLQKDSVDSIKYILDDRVLTDYQTIGASFCHLSNRALLGDDMGLGKTTQACAFLRLHQLAGTLGKVLFISQTNSLYQILAEIKVSTGLALLPVFGGENDINRVLNRYDYRDFDGIITTHSALGQSKQFSRRFIPIKQDFKTVIFDESEAVAKPTSIRYYVTKYLFRHFKNRLMLNGTALTSRLNQFHTQLDILDENLLPSMSKINSEFGIFDPKTHQVVGWKDTHLFTNRLKYHYLGRVRTDYNCEYKLHIINPTKMQSKMINNMNYNSLLTSPTTVDDSLPFTPKTTPALQALIDLTNERLKRGSVVIFAEYIECKYVIKSYLEKNNPNIKVAIIDGEISSQSEQSREHTRQAFERGEYNVLITNLSKSLNLGSAMSMIFYTIPNDVVQAVHRIIRFIVKDTKIFDFIIYKDTPQVNRIRNKFLKEEILMNTTLNKQYNIFQTLVSQLDTMLTFENEFGEAI